MPTLCPTYHVPVLLNETVDGLNLRPEGTYVDATFGGGGHSREILRRLGPEGRLYGFDQDADARNNVPDDERFSIFPPREVSRFGFGGFQLAPRQREQSLYC